METSVEFKTKIALNTYQLFFLKDYVKKLNVAIEKNLDHIFSLVGAISELNFLIVNKKSSQAEEVVFSLHPFDPKPIISAQEAINFLSLKKLGKKKNIKVSDRNAALKIREEVAKEFYNSALLDEMLKEEITMAKDLIKNLEDDNKLFETQAEYSKSNNKALDYSKLNWNRLGSHTFPDEINEIKKLFSANQKQHAKFRTLKKAGNGELLGSISKIVVAVKDRDEKSQQEFNGDPNKIYLIKGVTVKDKIVIQKIKEYLINIGIYPNEGSIKKTLRDMGFVKPQSYKNRS